MSTEEVLDLYDLSLLFNYERASTDPRFRNAKLREAVFNRSEFKTIRVKDADWERNKTRRQRAGFVFDIVESWGKIKLGSLGTRDLPSNMVLEGPASQNTRNLTRKQLETIYWQARGFDACYSSIVLLQHFFDMYPPDTLLAVRPPKEDPFITTISSWTVLDMTLISPKVVTLSIIQPSGVSHITGDEDSMRHVVLGFDDPQRDRTYLAVLDLSSMQFGDKGRGGNGGTFVLEDSEHYEHRLRGICDDRDMRFSTGIGRVPPEITAQMKEVAVRVKKRWEKRYTNRWCDGCGAPAKLESGAGNSRRWYCGGFCTPEADYHPYVADGTASVSTASTNGGLGISKAMMGVVILLISWVLAYTFVLQ